MLEKQVEIELADGSKIPVVIRRILRSEKRKLWSIVAPKEVDSQNPSFNVNFEKFEDYREQCLLVAIVSPASLKSLEAIQNLPDSSFDILSSAFGEINSVGPATEKK